MCGNVCCRPSTKRKVSALTHEERLDIASAIADKIVEKYGDRVSAIAIYGSVAKGEDSAHSDLDLWVATTQPIEDVRFFVYKGIPISINWDTENGRIKSAGHVTPFWPMDADELRSYIVLFERGDFLERLREAASNLNEEDFLSSIRVLMARVCETSNRLHNAWEAGDHYRLLVDGRLLTWGTAMMLGLLNRRYYKGGGGRGFYQLSKQMPKQPKDYANLLDLAGGFTTVEDEAVYRAGVALWLNLCDLVRDEGVDWQSNDLPI